MAVTSVQDLSIVADYGQFYVFASDSTAFVEADNPYLDALDEATSSRRFVGLAAGLVDVMTPGQYNFDTPMRIEVHDSPAPADEDRWDHQVELDFDCASGTIIFEGSGGSGTRRAQIPPGRYRARISGAGYADLGAAGIDGADHYRLQLWNRTADSSPRLVKYWPGWDAYA